MKEFCREYLYIPRLLVGYLRVRTSTGPVKGKMTRHLVCCLEVHDFSAFSLSPAAGTCVPIFGDMDEMPCLWSLANQAEVKGNTKTGGKPGFRDQNISSPSKFDQNNSAVVSELLRRQHADLGRFLHETMIIRLQRMTKKGEECEALVRSSCLVTCLNPFRCSRVSYPMIIWVICQHSNRYLQGTVITPGKLVQISPQQFE